MIHFLLADAHVFSQGRGTSTHSASPFGLSVDPDPRFHSTSAAKSEGGLWCPNEALFALNN